MAFVTHAQLLGAPTLTEGHVKLAKSLTEDKNLFLSHSRLDDLKLVRGAMAILEQHGAKVYVDRFDTEIAAMSMNDRCTHLREVIERCQRLVVLFSKQTHTSRWIPWELGLSDGIHGSVKIASLPVAMTSSEEPWGKQEYFALYPQIRHEQLMNKPAAEYVVHNPENGLFWTLSDWLRL